MLAYVEGPAKGSAHETPGLMKKVVSLKSGREVNGTERLGAKW